MGVQLPSSGGRAGVGRTIRNAIGMGGGGVNGEGGVNGTPLGAVWDDSRDSAEGAIAAVRALIAEPQVVAVVGELFSPFVMACREAVDQAGIPYIIGGTSPRTTEGAQWIFRVAATDDPLAALLAPHT